MIVKLKSTTWPAWVLAGISMEAGFTSLAQLSQVPMPLGRLQKILGNQTLKKRAILSALGLDRRLNSFVHHSKIFPLYNWNS